MPKEDTYFTKENASEMGKRGSAITNEKRRQKKSMREDMKMILALPITDEIAESDCFTSFNALADPKRSNPTVQKAIMAGLAKRAASGDPNAAKLVREIVGNDEQGEAKPRDIELAPHIIRKFYTEPHYDLLMRTSRDFWLPGGRGSTKSSWAAFEIIKDIEEHPNHCAVAFRKVGNTLRDSVFAQLQFAINKLGLTEDYDCTVSPMKIVKKITGQEILFRGCDDPKKAKSITLPNPKMFIAIAWFEEADQFSGMDEIRSLRQTVSRGGDDFIRIYTYNPPRSRDSWVNKEILNADDKYIVTSTYLDVPVEWLGQTFIDDAEALKEWNEDAYRHEYLGEPVGYGSQVFENLEIRQITQDEINACSYHYNGVDWGYYPDPWVFIRVGVQKAQRRIYIYGELTGNRLSNEETAERIKDYLHTQVKHFEDEVITCDSAEPKSIEEYRRLGLKAQQCTKYAGSVESGMKALAGEWQIIIDPATAPLAAQEFNGYEFERLKTGEVVSRYPDKDNHTIDATRYALERILAGKEN